MANGKERHHLAPGSLYGHNRVLSVAGQRVRCLCGICASEHEVDYHNLASGKTTRCQKCGWAASGLAATDARIRHIEKGTRKRLQNRISAAIARCTDPFNPAYANYGGRGITVHQPWIGDRPAFLLYVVTLPGWDDPKQTLDRIDNDVGYVPGNLRFRTHREQQSNRQDTIWIEHDGRKLTLQEFHREYAPGYARRHTIARKLRDGFTPERIIAEQHDVSRGAYGPRAEPVTVRYAGKDWTPHSLWKGPASGYRRVRDIVRQIEKGLDGDAIVADQHAYNGRSGPGVRPSQLRAA